MREKDNIELLNAVVQNTEMGKNTLDQMIPLAEKPEFKAELMEEQRGYSDLNQKAHRALDACGAVAEGQTQLAKLRTRVGIAGRTLTDHSTRKLAQMLLEGSQMGVTDCVTSKKDCPEASAGAKRLAEELQQFEEQNMDTLRRFL